MLLAHKNTWIGLLIGVALTAGGAGAYAHIHGGGHRMPPGAGMLSMTGSPSDLAERAHHLTRHICEVIDALEDCSLIPLGEAAARDLHAQQATFSEGQAQLHDSLVAIDFDRAAVDRIRDQLAMAIQVSTLRYSEFLADCSAVLTAEQRQRFALPHRATP